jgi:hypothetical protein
MLTFPEIGLGACVAVCIVCPPAQAQAPMLQVTPATDISVRMSQDGKFDVVSFRYALTSSNGSIRFLISGIPSWLNASFTTGTATTQSLTVTLTLSETAKTLTPGSYDGEIIFINAMNGQGTQARKARLDVPARE